MEGYNNMAALQRSPLGRGLKSLLPASEEERGLSLDGNDPARPESPYFLCPIAFIEPNPYQPRKMFNDDELVGLSGSIREKGVLQPLVVRKVSTNRYELIAGERRLRASKMAELEKVPVIVKDIAISERLELALIENIQRENLNPLEEAEAYAQLVEKFDQTQETVAKRVGKKRSTVTNSIRLLQLPDFALKSLGEGLLSTGHAKVLLGFNDPIQIKKIHDEIIKNKLSVRETENIAKRAKDKSKEIPSSKPRKRAALPATYCKTVRNNLCDYLASKSKVVQIGSRGKIEIQYKSQEDLERIMALIVKEQ